ncbi:Demethylmenaquinone methyltransferase [Actinomadura rubteroloni]|uniref:Demethylmenaquinone methyltransferase n=1 Tax=Actinomadura rubteroloni TaxID=1926885 RepID=A0A2P4UJR6_9ACTN|nr:class I SAM-dependent methyltransferase [Actinomadura rubteroloni]POM25292.1 Demethylmenaquinone methyltransferase [Actinomadura rubteroloni]
MPEYRDQALLLGLQGLALLRGAIDGTDGFIAARTHEMREVLAEPEPPGKPVADLDVSMGYASLAAAYDSEPDAFIQVEEPVVRAFTDGLPTGTALDAACGTGRHAAALLARGHDVTGVDQSAEMLDRARAKAPKARLLQGDLTALPLPGDTVDLAVCGLALSHLPDIVPAIRELARVTRPGGRVIITDVHPTMTALRGTFLFRHDDRLGRIRNHAHPVSSYLAAFAAAGLDVEQCAEPESNGTLPPHGYERRYPDAARAAWAGLPFVLAWRLRVRG